jgi:hypothetical protein
MTKKIPSPNVEGKYRWIEVGVTVKGRNHARNKFETKTYKFVFGEM